MINKPREKFGLNPFARGKSWPEFILLVLAFIGLWQVLAGGMVALDRLF